ncbi:MAG: hypothetical protein ACXQTW_01185 [Candidatus Methanospirareceae archaeon]
MIKMEQKNIDRLCADIGFSIPEEYKKKDELSKQENTIRKALGILAQDGIFAYLIWLESEAGEIKWDEKENNFTKLGAEKECSRRVVLNSIKLLNESKILNPLQISDDDEKKALEGSTPEDPDGKWKSIVTKFRNELTKPDGVLEDIHLMFLVKQLFERMLTYALYKARALEK